MSVTAGPLIAVCSNKLAAAATWLIQPCWLLADDGQVSAICFDLRVQAWSLPCRPLKGSAQRMLVHSRQTRQAADLSDKPMIERKVQGRPHSRSAAH